MSLTRELPRYECNKQVQALKIAHMIANPRGIELHFADERFTPHQVLASWADLHKVESGGYLVVYATDLISYMPRAAFEQTYILITGNQP